MFKTIAGHQIPKVAGEDITTFKPMIPTTKIGCYYSNIRYFPYESGFHYQEDEFAKFKTAVSIYPGLSSFETTEAALSAIGEWKDSVVVECTIPAGTEYFYCSSTKSYLSRELIIGEEVLYLGLHPESEPYSEEAFASVGAWNTYGAQRS